MASSGRRVTKNSIAVSFTLIIIFIFIICQGPLWLWFLFTQKDKFGEMLHERAQMSARMISSVAGDYIGDGNIASLKKTIDKIAEDEIILSIKVFDMNGVLVTSAFSRVEERDSASPLYISWRNTARDRISVGTKEFGMVEVSYSGAKANNAMFWLLSIPPIAQAFVFALITLAIFWFTYLRVGKPIGILSERLERITSGDLTVEIPEMDGKEIEAIADGLRYLVQRFSATVRRMHSLASNVMETTGGLSSSFKNSMEMVKKQSTSTDEIALSLKGSLESQKKISDSTEQLSGISGENVSSLMEVKASEDEIVTHMASLYDATEKSYTIVSDMVDTTTSVNENVQRVLASVENTSASVEEIIASVKEVESSARESSRIANDVREQAAHNGVVTVGKAITGMSEITDKVTYSVDIVGRLGKRSDDVQRILSVMKEVTDQTNLLSINASILAEQAGEHGKGFSVVAEEMRELSEKTGAYTKDIAGIISMIKREISDVVIAITEGMRFVEEGSLLVYDVGETMSAILEAAHESANMTKMIERSTESQVIALRHVEDSVIEVNTMSLEMNKVMDKLFRSTEFILLHIGEVKEVAETTKQGIFEQSEGVKSIAQNIEITN
ncbi:MAG: hypothetical protein KAR83_06320, partial [Thermodesulfovibrionales bacterium]|nr:hypothetical protein [Thermodesulfovibrionales bacterium]